MALDVTGFHKQLDNLVVESDAYVGRDGDLVCCVRVNQCDNVIAEIWDSASCQEEPCEDSSGLQMSCPDSGWCCVPG